MSLTPGLEPQSRMKTLLSDLRVRIERDPVRSFFVGIGIGLCVALFGRILLPLLLIVVIVAGLLWFFSEEERAPNDRGADDLNGPVPPTMSDRI